ncbi:hypothetical protein SBOR_6635 [Sclerotinia borealis F-4128]|uniref:RRM domain-containing protein n=1 Tax=Sclerotinia borealis (strain F-4128) TaxID=1432307 RepID=W9CDU1_SCLBF|nr:hypothetical protein SBOR_6635 [Sclerotinia borealis F-4128]
MATKNDFPDFNGFINKGRERRKDELLANKFLSKNRRASAPGVTNNRKPGTGPSLASRMGVGKRGAAVFKPAPKQNSKPAVGNVDAEWTHDLHPLNNPGASRGSQIPPRGPRDINTRTRNDRLAKAFNGSASTPNLNAQYNIVGKSKAPTGSLSIKGLAGPYIVLAENFAQGTSAQDIESAMAPVGGAPLSCRLLSDYPKVIAEIIFDSKDGADNVIETFNNQEADGNLLYVYHKSAALAQTPKLANQRSVPRSIVPTGPKAGRFDRSSGSDNHDSRYRTSDSSRSSRDDVIDGSHGFDDRMDTDDQDEGRHNNNGRSQGLYSDNLVGGRNSNNNISRNGNNWNGARGNDRSRGYR